MVNGRERAITAADRPIFVANYALEDTPSRHAALRQNFPPAGDTYSGGNSDGYEYRSNFAGSSLAQSYAMVKAFLAEEGYGDLPIPRDENELLLFRLPVRNKQILLFEDNGYVHNPIKILFPLDRRKRNTLILCLYNEEDPQHLLKFHGLL